jgi:hypothetical protein
MENGPVTADGLGNQACDEDDEEACAVRTELEALVAHIQHQVFASAERADGRARVFREYAARARYGLRHMWPTSLACCRLLVATENAALLFLRHMLHAVT